MSYSYVHTTGDVITRGLDKQLLKPYVSKYLFSLINGLSRNKFKYGMPDTAKKIKTIFENLYPGEELFIDSGGYSIIVGDVVYNSTVKMEIPKFIDNVYLDFLKTYATQYCHKIFSLDIPIFLTNPKHNTCKNILECNIDATKRSKLILDQNIKLYDKYVWVWQFKIRKQFNIWRTVFDDVFGKDNNIKHYAVGGLVGVRGLTNINFSPFIGPAFKILKLIKDKNLPETSLMHILGVYGKHDRFIMMFMDKLFNQYYLKDSKCSVDITFDTVNYTLSGLYKVREIPMTQIPLIDPKEDKIEHTAGINDYIDTLILDETVKTLILQEIKLIEAGQPINDPKLLSLTYVIYSYLLDFIMNKAINEEKLVEIFVENNSNWNKRKAKLIPKINKLIKQYPFVFGNMGTQLLENLEWVSHFDIGWNNGASEDMNRIDNGIIKFIQAINYPFDLEGSFDYDRH